MNPSHFWLVMVACANLGAAADVADEKIFNVCDHGAKGDRTSNDRAAIQMTINACAAAGGGKVMFLAGDYLCGGQ